MQRRPIFVGASLAATLPAALAAAVLVSAPFAGTTTNPLADEHTTAGTGAAVAAQPARPSAASAGSSAASGSQLGDMVMLGGAEAAFVGLGLGVLVTVRRRSRRYHPAHA